MSKVSMNDYQEWCLTKFNGKLDKASAIANCAMGLCGESGEVSEIAKKWLFHDRPLDERHLSEELGDVLFYLCVLAALLGVSIEQIISLNQEKLNQRYPNGFKGGNGNV